MLHPTGRALSGMVMGPQTMHSQVKADVRDAYPEHFAIANKSSAYLGKLLFQNTSLLNSFVTYGL